MKRQFITLGAVGTVIFLIVLMMFRPNPLQGKFPSDFSETDKREISSLVRSDAYHRSFGALRHGEFKSAWRWMVNARKQRVWSVGEQPNGDTRVHLGVEDKSRVDGYWMSARYFMKKENGHWKLVQMF
jgi:hypothetical protein